MNKFYQEVLELNKPLMILYIKRILRECPIEVYERRGIDPNHLIEAFCDYVCQHEDHKQ